MSDTKSNTENNEPATGFVPTAETSGITRLSKTDSETEGDHLRRVADELSGSGEERLGKLRAMLSYISFHHSCKDDCSTISMFLLPI